MTGCSTPPTDASFATVRALITWSATQLAPHHVAYLRSFQPTLSHALGGTQMLCCFHGSPRSYDEVLAPTTDDATLVALLAGLHATIFAGGHTHVQLLRRYQQGWFVNPGSVGLPGTGPGTPDLLVNRAVRWAEYAVIDSAGDATSITFRRVPLDMAQVRAAGAASGMPHLDWWLGLWGS